MGAYKVLIKTMYCNSTANVDRKAEPTGSFSLEILWGL